MQTVIFFNFRDIADRCIKLKNLMRRSALVLSVLSVVILFLTISLIFNTPKSLYFSKRIDKSSNNIETNALKQKEDLYNLSVKSAEDKAMELIKDGDRLFIQDKSDAEYNTDTAFADYNLQEPPKLIVKAVIKIAGKVSACADIDGVAEGIMLVPGMSFLSYGKIVAINDKSIEWEWKGKEYKTNF